MEKEPNFFSPLRISIDDTQPWLIEIGNDVQITGGVRILAHDYSWSVLKKAYSPIWGWMEKLKLVIMFSVKVIQPYWGGDW